MGRAYRSSFHAQFTGQVYRRTLLVSFMGLIYLLSFLLLFEPSLWIEFTNRSNILVKFTSRVYGR